MKRLWVVAFVVGCAVEPTVELSDVDQAATVCGSGPTVKGIDVSFYQGTIDWAKVKADGVVYSFIRVSDGLNSIDSKFTSYWADSRAHGVIHGAYQFFRPSQDPIAQADLLLSKMGTPKPDDLPPVIDVEAADGLPAATVAAKVKQWVTHVKAAIGKDPIIYTGFYFWRDSVGAPNLTTSPLWHAQYTTAACPNIAPPWQDWAFWQYTSSGSINGIAGNVDTNRFNGTMAELLAMTGGGAQPSACAALPAEGGTIDDGDACFAGGGPSQYMRHVTDAGQNGDLVWTHATSDPAEANFGQWNLKFTEAGTYTVEVYTAGKYAQSKQATYVVHASGGDVKVKIDQSAVDGWQSLGDFAFAAGADQSVHLADNTGEPVANNIQIVFDAVKVTRSTPPDGSGGGGDPTGDPMPPNGGGCSAGGGGSSLPFLFVGLVGLLRRRRR